MKKIFLFCATVSAVTFISCLKEYSQENTGGPNDLIVGVDCRISKIAYTNDTAAISGIGAITAVINSLDIVTRVTKFDSLSNTIEFIANPLLANDTVYLSNVNTDEYFIRDINNRIDKLHGLSDPTDPLSPQFDVSYFYNTTGYLTSKIYSYTITPGTPFRVVVYTYTGNNLTHMTSTDLLTGDLEVDADISYFNNIIPRRYLYLFPDEKAYSYFNQFYNFGERPRNAVREILVRNYDPGNTVRDSITSTFSDYIMSRDNYVLSVQMTGDDQPSIPASVGKLSFSYMCK
ncbi:MAG: hypothetical protein WBP16_07830 [Ferruginibacter sp.]